MNQKKLLLLALLLTVSSLVFAQGIVAKGFKGGLNISNLTGDDTTNTIDSNLGFSAGAFATFGINELLSLQPELLLTTKGANSKFDIFETKYEYSEVLTYIEVPLLFKINLKTASELNPNIFAGPAIAFNIHSTYELKLDDEENSGDVENIKPINFDIVLGGGIDIKKLTFDIRYDLSLSKLYDNEEMGDFYNSVISFMIGIKI